MTAKKQDRIYRILIWGGAAIYNFHLPRIQQMEDRGEIRIVGIYDKGIRYGKTLDGYPILKREEIVSTPHDYLFVMAGQREKEVIEEYMELDGDRQKVIPFRVLDIPNIGFQQYLDIKNAGFSILSETCFGGYISHTFGMEHLSPFKNLWIGGEDYLKILEDLPHYMSATPQLAYYRESSNRYDQPVYPVLQLDDVQLMCNHDSDADAAVANWERRKAKINYNNLFATILTSSEEHMERFLSLKGYQRKLCFMPYETDRKGVVYIPVEGNGDLYSLHRVARDANNLLDIYTFFFGEVRYRRQ
ncbi:MAG: DUF1919 domain-containing protein [Oscillospiraceae bacterium]|nr:DUF1919 domain-containing protein [Oscillospiraceae bacterium]